MKTTLDASRELSGSCRAAVIDGVLDQQAAEKLRESIIHHFNATGNNIDTQDGYEEILGARPSADPISLAGFLVLILLCVWMPIASVAALLVWVLG